MRCELKLDLFRDVKRTMRLGAELSVSRCSGWKSENGFIVIVDNSRFLHVDWYFQIPHYLVDICSSTRYSRLTADRATTPETHIFSCSRPLTQNAKAT
jgi:hypothetical protein